VTKEKEIAGGEQAKVAEIEKTVTAKASDCERDLARALPALQAAEEALNTLDKTSLTYVNISKIIFHIKQTSF
jgi:dynein heavy chain